MRLSRREFLGYAAGAATLVLPRDARPPGKAPLTVLLDVRPDLRESVLGYEATLAGFGTPFTRAEPRRVPRCATLICPAAVRLSPAALRAIATCLDDGAMVLLESGAMFAAGGELRAHRAVLRDALQIQVEPPVHLWRAAVRSRRIPYIDYTWPHPAKVRDFSRVLPLGREAGEIIASVDGLPVALKRRSRRGALIFLGSPLGPALWAGDDAARRWLRAVAGVISS